MVLHELTSEQQYFAECNHNFVYAFLLDNELPQDDFYDVVIFGYLFAVQEYCNRADLRENNRLAQNGGQAGRTLQASVASPA